MLKTLAFSMLFTYLSALLLPCFAKAETKLCYEFEQQKSKTDAEEDYSLKEYLPIPLTEDTWTALLLLKNRHKSQKNYKHLPMNFQGKNSPIFSPPPEICFFIG